MPVTGGLAPQKVNLTRAQRRAALRAQLRDPLSTVWADADLNLCLDEALQVAQELYPRFAVTFPSLNALGQYPLPNDVGQVLEAWLWHGQTSSAPYAFDVTTATPVRGRVVEVPLFTQPTTNGNTPALQRIFVPDDSSAFALATDGLAIRYVAARSIWTDDTTAYDLTPESNSPHLGDLLFYATARLAAFRFAMQIVPSSGGRDFEKQYGHALDEYQRLLAQALPPYRPLTLRSTYY